MKPGVGRLSFTGGALLAMGGAAGFFTGIALVLLLTVGCVLALRRHVQR